MDTESTSVSFVDVFECINKSIGKYDKEEESMTKGELKKRVCRGIITECSKWREEITFFRELGGESGLCKTFHPYREELDILEKNGKDIPVIDHTSCYDRLFFKEALDCFMQDHSSVKEIDDMLPEIVDDAHLTRSEIVFALSIFKFRFDTKSSLILGINKKMKKKL